MNIYVIGNDPIHFLDLDFKIKQGCFYTKIMIKGTVFFYSKLLVFYGDVPLARSYGVNISQLVRFARVCTKVSDLNGHNLYLTGKLLQQG